MDHRVGIRPDEARGLLISAGFAEAFDYGPRWTIQAVIEGQAGDAVTPDDERDAVEYLLRLVAEGEAPAETVEAFRVLAGSNRRRYAAHLATFRREIENQGTEAVGHAAEAAGLLRDPTLFDALMDADDEHRRRYIGSLVAVLGHGPRARECRPGARRTRSRRGSSSPGRSTDDDPHEPDVGPDGGVAA